MVRLVCDLLDASAERFPEKIVLLQGEVRWTFAEIEMFSNRLARILIDQCLKKGDRVLMVMESSCESAACYYGILKAGGVCVEIHDRSTPAEVAYYRDNSGAGISILSRNPLLRDLLGVCWTWLSGLGWPHTAWHEL